MNKYCMCILNQEKKESLGFMPSPRKMLKSAGVDLDSAELGLRKVKKMAVPVISVGLTLFVGTKVLKVIKKGNANKLPEGRSIKAEILYYDPEKPTDSFGPTHKSGEAVFTDFNSFNDWVRSELNQVNESPTYDEIVKECWNYSILGMKTGDWRLASGLSPSSSIIMTFL